MSKFYAQDYKITLNGSTLSNSISSVEVALEADELEVSAFGDGWRQKIAGLKQGSVKIDFFQDFGAGAVEATIFPLLGTIATVVVSPTSGTIGSTNPSYTIPALVTQHTPISGAIGDIATFSVTWPSSGTVTKAVSA